jgi:acyl transferase domain-containing protein/NADPH:quinone reductase-like Zn-dependent oxidoreductase/acyl carrier protein
MPVAVVGLAYRLPGAPGAGFWEALISGRDLVTTVAPDRWSQDAYLHSRRNEPGTSITFAAGSIGDVSGFDAAFFGISPREAEQMDPQQRLLLEMTWEALEDAGIPASRLRGTRCGVYVGLSSLDYAYRRADDLGAIDASTMTGNTASIAANRLSYVFDLRGPSMAVDTACSSSLVALHQACQSLRAGESDTAVVGGISLHLHPYAFVGFSKASMLSPRGRCAVFDEHGDGYVRAEGGAVLLLKPLARALADGNRVLALVAATGVNSDGRGDAEGRKPGMTVPSHAGQAALLREVYERAGIAPADIDYFEAHGTGTAVGDPIEARAIGEALGRRRPAGRPLAVGSVKSNLGHLEAAAGMAGLVKALHVLRHRRVPANLHLETPHPAIDLAGWNLSPVTHPLALPDGRRLVVGVSSFGFGGTNAHAVLTSHEAPPAPAAATPEGDAARPARVPLLLSARSPAALRETARRMSAFLRARPDVDDYDIAYSAALHRDHHSYRLSATATDRAALAGALQRFADSGAAEGVVPGRYRAGASAPVFVYSGNGSQWAGMGLALLEREAAFRAAVQEVDALFAARAGVSIIEEMRAAATADRYALTEVAQPALFALQVGLTQLLASQGIRPAAVCGHSVGEVAAAWASGALSLEEAVRVIHERSAHQATTRGHGCMAAVALGAADTVSILTAFALGDRIALTAINAPGSVTVGGDAEAMGRFEAILAQRRVACRRLALDYAFHSAAMDPIRAPLLASLAGLPHRGDTLPWISSVTGARIEAAQTGAEYWWRNVREPVLFEAAVRALLESGLNTFVEIGPRPVLTGYLNDNVRHSGKEALVIPALPRSEPEAGRMAVVGQLLELSGALHDPRRLFPRPGRYVELPAYAWERDRYWHPSSSESLGLLHRETVHPLLGYALAGDALHWENHLDTTRLPAFADHAVGGAAVFPAAGFIEMALAAASARGPGGACVVEDLEIVAPLLLEAERSRSVRLRVDPADGRFAITSRERLRDDPWVTHVTGRLVGEHLPGTVPAVARPARAADVPAAAHYELTQSLGLQYGPAFQSLTGIWFDSGGAYGAIAAPACVAAQAEGALLSPFCLDGAFQMLADFVLHESGGRTPGTPSALLPVRFARIELLHPQARIASAWLSPGAPRHRSRRSAQADFTLFDAAGEAVATVRGARFRATPLARADAPAPRWVATRAVPMPRRHAHSSAALPPTAELARAVERRLHAAERAGARLRYGQEFEPLLDALCASFAEAALRELAGESALAPEQWIESGAVAAGAGPLLGCLLQVLADDGVVEHRDNAWHWLSSSGLPPADEIWTSLVADYPAYAAINARVGAAGLHLAERLRSGRESGRPAGAFGWADSSTREEGAALFAAVGDLLEAALAVQPVHERLRVLRLVGHTPSEAWELFTLPGLDADRCDIVVGAPTRAILDDVRGRWPWTTGLSCQVVDLDDASAPVPAGAAQRFHLIVLGEGLADAPDRALRLQRLRRLLFADGALVVLEQFPSRALDLIHGLDPAWWRAGAGQWPSARLCAPEDWTATLAAAGFADLQVVRDAPGATTGPFLVIGRAAGAGAAVEAAAETPAAGIWLLARDEAGYSAELGKALAAQLALQGQEIIEIVGAPHYARFDERHFALDPASAIHWDQLLAELRRAGKELHGWIHLAGLDAGRARVATPARRAAAQEQRAAVLMAWLQSCSRNGLRADGWVVGAQAGLGLLPEAARPPGGPPGGDADGAPDMLRDAALWGLARVAMQEFAELHLRWVDLVEPLPVEANAARLALELLAPDAEDEILLAGDGRYATRFGVVAPPRVALAPPLVPPPVQLDFAVPGSFRHLGWQADERGAALGDDEVEIEVRAAGLNFRDVMYAMGLLPDEAVEDGFCGASLGMEVAGTITRVGAGVLQGPPQGIRRLAPGDAVIAFAPASFATRVRTVALAVAHKPEGWSFAAAATVPTAFFTAYYALIELARLREGERVLIHGAAGGVGIAAIQLARHLGAEVFATAGSAEKRDFVRLLGADRVFDSRAPAFDDAILQATDGEGVDVVLNSLAGEAVHRNLRLLRPFGRMLELGKRDFYENSRLGLRPFRNNISYFGIDADQLLARRPALARRVFEELMALFADGSLRPLPYQAFRAGEAAAAFRHMQASRHIGKIVLTLPEGFDPAGPRFADPPAPALRADATYLVTGGLSGFGLRTAWWLVRLGARHLALLGRRGAGAPEAQEALAQFAAAGVSAHAIACDVADESALRSALAAIDQRMPPLRGVVHSAMVIEDALLRDMNRDQLHRVLAPKLLGGLNLHEATRTRPLDFFVLYSSATTLFGNPGQGAYVAANLALEALAAERLALGLPATCVGWGPIADAGYLARNERVRDALVGRIGGHALTADAALRALEDLMGAKASHLALLELDWSVLGRFLPAARAPKFSELARLADAGVRGRESPQDLRRWLEELGTAELHAALCEFVRGEIAQILRTAPERIESTSSLFDMGMDSLMAVELATSIEARLGIQLSALSLSDGPTIERVVERILRQLRPDEEGAEAAPNEVAEQVRAVAAQHASEVGEHEAASFTAEFQQRPGGDGARPLTGAAKP